MNSFPLKEEMNRSGITGAVQTQSWAQSIARRAE